MISKKLRYTFYSYPRFINVDIEECFDRISHSSILEYTAIVNKYRFFIKAWIYGPKVPWEKSCIKTIPRRGVSQGSIIGPVICHFVLDGLENYLLKSLSHRYLYNDEEINRIR